MTVSEERALGALRFVVVELARKGWPVAVIAKALRISAGRVSELLDEGRAQRAGRAA